MAHLETMMKSFLTALSIVAASVSPLSAEEDFASAIKGEILHGWQKADGTRVAAIKLTLAPGWKTYWRTPGDAGIPPEFDWSGSRNLYSVAMSWPTPTVARQAGMLSIGYYDQVVLPLSLAPRTPGAPMTLRATLNIGVCKDICMPHQMELATTIDDTNGTPTPAIAAALADRPYSAKEAGVRAATCRLRPKAGGFEIVADVTMPTTGSPEVVVIEPGQPDIWTSETDVQRSGNRLIATGDMAAMNGGMFSIDRSRVKITVFGSNKAVEIAGCTGG